MSACDHEQMSHKSSAKRARVQGGWAQRGKTSSAGSYRPSSGSDSRTHMHTFQPSSSKQKRSSHSFVDSLRSAPSENLSDFSVTAVNDVTPGASNIQTAVANIRERELKKFGYADLQDWLKNPNHVYIGRDMTRYVPGAVGSKWGNPFKSRVEGREESCQRYRDYVITGTQRNADEKTLFESLGELKGKTLGCWCHPEMCHGHVLAKLVEEFCN